MSKWAVALINIPFVNRWLFIFLTTNSKNEYSGILQQVKDIAANVEDVTQSFRTAVGGVQGEVQLKAIFENLQDATIENITVKIISLADLIKVKKYSKRLKDKADAEEFANAWRLKQIVKKYSDFVVFDASRSFSSVSDSLNHILAEKLADQINHDVFLNW